MLKKTLLLPLVCGLSVMANAGGFAGIGYTKMEEGGFDAEPTAIMLRIGKQFSDTAAVEFRLGRSLDNDTVTVLTTPVDVELEQVMGVYGRFNLKTDGALSPYLLLGITDGEIKYTSRNGAVEDSESDISYGAGLNFDTSDQMGVNIEYVKYIDKGDAEANGLTAGLYFAF